MQGYTTPVILQFHEDHVWLLGFMHYHTISLQFHGIFLSLIADITVSMPCGLLECILTGHLFKIQEQYIFMSI